MSKTKLYVLATMILGIAGLQACSESKAPKLDMSKPSVALEGKVQRMNPANARVGLVDKIPQLTTASETSTLKVPGFTLTFDGADRAQILRCASDFVLEDSMGMPVANLDTSDSYNRDRMRWAWQEAFNKRTKCRLIGSAITRQNVQDLAAETGSFYYVVNPCVSENLSTEGREGCSYALAVSEPITYENTLKKEFIEHAIKLANLEGTLAAHLEQMKSLSGLIRIHQEACEIAWNQKQARKSFFKAIVSLAIMVVGAVIGGIMTGGNPMGVVKGAQTALSVARGLLAMFDKPEKIKCDLVRDQFSQLKHHVQQFDETVSLVVTYRNRMAEADATYAKIDGFIHSETSSGGSSSSGSASQAEAGAANENEESSTGAEEGGTSDDGAGDSGQGDSGMGSGDSG